MDWNIYDRKSLWLNGWLFLVFSGAGGINIPAVALRSITGCKFSSQPDLSKPAVSKKAVLCIYLLGKTLILFQLYFQDQSFGSIFYTFSDDFKMKTQIGPLLVHPFLDRDEENSLQSAFWEKWWKRMIHFQEIKNSRKIINVVNFYTFSLSTVSTSSLKDEPKALSELPSEQKKIKSCSTCFTK